MSEQGLGSIELLLALFLSSLFCLALSTLYFSSARQIQALRLEREALLSLQNAATAKLLNDQSYLDRWPQQANALLPEGKGTFACDKLACKLSIAWYDHGLDETPSLSLWVSRS